MANDAPAPAPKKHSDGIVGELLANRYQIESKLGEGAMGAVYRARHVKFGRSFAVKVLHSRLLEDKKLAMRFEREAELAGRLHHANVIGVVDVGETTDGLRYMVMDFAQGRDLADILGEAPLPPERIIPLVRQLLEGLFHAHEAGLIHRDFKPENVIVERDDHGKEVPRIVDFGISILREGGDSTAGRGRLTTNGLVLGTPHYMAPEQAVADPIDHRIDLFAMGIVIYEMLSGMLPFDGAGAEVARANLLLDPPPISQRVPGLEVDPLLEAFARRLMAKKRDHRPADAKQARELLDLIERDRGAAAIALGVPLAVGTRPPQATEPMTPVMVAAAIGAATAAHQPSALEGPPVRQVQVAGPAGSVAANAGTADAPARLGAVSTARAEPLAWSERASSSKRRWLIAGGVGLAGALVLAALGVFGGDGDGGSGGGGAKAPAGPQVAMTVEPAPAPAAPIVTPLPAQPEVTDRAAPPPGTEPPPTTENVAAPQPAVDSTATKPAPDPTRGRPTNVRKPGPSQPSQIKTKPETSNVAKQVPTTGNPTTATQTTATQNAAPLSADVTQRWQQVGAAINALKQSPATKADGDRLFARWIRIQIQTAQLNEQSRKAALAELADLQRQALEASAKR